MPSLSLVMEKKASYGFSNRRAVTLEKLVSPTQSSDCEAIISQLWKKTYRVRWSALIFNLNTNPPPYTSPLAYYSKVYIYNRSRALGRTSLFILFARADLGEHGSGEAGQ